MRLGKRDGCTSQLSAYRISAFCFLGGNFTTIHSGIGGTTRKRLRRRMKAKNIRTISIEKEVKRMQ